MLANNQNIAAVSDCKELKFFIRLLQLGRLPFVFVAAAIEARPVTGPASVKV